MAQSVLEINGVDKKIGSRTILENINLDVREGEIFGLLGPNGAGKTTLIRMICGLMKHSGGAIRVLGSDIQKSYLSAIREIGAVIENPAFYLELTGWQNLRLVANLYTGITKERIQEVVELIQLEDSIHDKVASYSLGMKQRLGIGQAILHKPRLLILDEPTNGLDPTGMHDLRQHLLRLAREEGTAIFLSTHLLSEVEMLCDRIAIMKDGRIVDIRETVQEEVLVIETSEPDKAAMLLSERYAVISNDNGWIRLAVDKSQVPAVNALLVQEGIDVFHLAFENQGLEQVFLQSVSEGRKPS
ncbi:hypothetical protein AC622_08630 [Bacillus sp. FJAT-27916]|uniref:ABC transporter ATP-binding protein n=1 Tax=Bacillus sp. FJAT-27916 TaxID=1679169 RepID=UPI000670E262|nr:ABC transporter ATP-binding protein [Bacillus sp. FJAT-27916]KMY44309.1 hypothetical protein AC622_08630 [Bacillus sp. FJAT-27916]